MRADIGYDYWASCLDVSMDLTARFKDQFVALVREYAATVGRDYDAYYEPNFNNLSKLAESDLRQFFRAIDNGCVETRGDGHLHIGESKERIFDHGEQSRTPRHAKVCVEPILSQVAIARLMLDYGWPQDAIKTQWGAWKFDLSVFRDGVLHIQCEIKTSPHEVSALAQFLVDSSRGAAPAVDSPKKLLNWSRKFDDLALHQPRLVWVLGPGGAESVLKYVQHDGAEVLAYADAEHLRYDSA